MAKTSLRKEKWTLTFDPRLKSLLIKEARKKGVYPVSLLEDIVREQFNPYGFTDVGKATSYVRSIRKTVGIKLFSAAFRRILSSMRAK